MLGLHSGGKPPPSAIAVVADSASSAAAIRMKRINVFFMDAPLLGLRTGFSTFPSGTADEKEGTNSKVILALRVFHLVPLEHG